VIIQSTADTGISKISQTFYVKRLTLFLVALLCGNLLSGQLPQLPDLPAYTVSGVTSVSFKPNKKRNKGKVKTEVPPWIIPGGWKSYCFVDGSDTYIWSSPSPLTANRTIDFKKEGVGPYNISKSYINSSEYNSQNSVQHWKRTYHAVYSAAYIKHPVAGAVSLGFLHGENKNLVAGSITNSKSKRYPNTIQKNVPIDPKDPESYSGGSPYREGWKAYNGIISAAWVPNNEATNWGQQFFSNELGPIVWPATAYVTRFGIKCTSGLRHPSSIVYNNYVYVFYVESGAYGNNIPDEEGRGEGIKVARAPINDALNPLSYQVYYKAPNGVESWKRSLPDGFTKEKMLNYIAVKGAKASDLMNDQKDQSQEIRFSVAKVENANYFIGVEEYIDHADKAIWKVGLRFSADLVHWTDRKFIVKEARDWKDIHINYPIFLSHDGWSNTEIDIKDFYIIGTDPGVHNSVNKIHFQAPSANATNFATSFMIQSQGQLNSVLPNPNTGLFTVNYTVDSLSHVEIILYNLFGQQMQSRRGEKKPGKYIEGFNISDYPAGMYLVAIKMRNRYNIYKILKR
jgi:hypothetical protein